MSILLGDCLEKLKELPDNSVDACVTDPPYGLKFMGKKWDYGVPSIAIFSECLRVLKPGAHLLSFGGTRTYHRMVVNIEDAGFEIRDQIQWLYGSGFPKSHNIGNGIGTALKPANEPIVLARKPLSESTVAKNVLRWGVGGLNIDATRVGYGETGPDRPLSQVVTTNAAHWGNSEADAVQKYKAQGRWPSNLLLDEAAAFMLDEQSGVLKSAGEYKKSKIEPLENESKFGLGNNVRDNSYAGQTGGASRFFYVAKASKRERNAGLDKPSTHPTVKPLELMEYLIKLITPPNGTVLDPFMGSGSTGVAAFRLGYKFIGCEMNEEYCEIAKKRIEHAAKDSAS